MLRFISRLQKRLDDAKVDDKVSSDNVCITEAFDDEDTANLNAIFANKPVVRDKSKADSG